MTIENLVEMLQELKIILRTTGLRISRGTLLNEEWGIPWMLLRR